MKENKLVPNFDTARFLAPTPGMSLTTEPGNRPWEKPAKYPDSADALNFYIRELSFKNKVHKLFDVLERGFPVTALVDSVIVAGVMEGLHTLDVGIIIAPALFHFITGLADVVGVEHRTGLEEASGEDRTLVHAAIKESEEEEMEDEPDELIEIAEEGLEEIQTGLMARPSITEQGEE